MKIILLFALAVGIMTGCALHPAALVVPFLGFVSMIAILTLIVFRWEARARAEVEAEAEPVPEEDEFFLEQLPTHEELMARYAKTQDDETSI